MICPQCKQDDGYKTLEDYRWWFSCVACGFRCLMKNYRASFKNN